MNPYAHRPTRTIRRTGRVARPGTAATRQIPRRRGSPSILLGGIAIVCFIFFWMFLALAVNVLIAAAPQHGAGGMIVASGVIGLTAFLFPLAGLVCGIIGVLSRRSHKAVAAVGTGLNGLLLLFILYRLIQ